MTAMADIKQICTELASLARREHYFCEDSWYSCPKAEGGCANDAEGTECNCGADAHNAKVNELLAAALAEPEPEGQSALDDVHYEWELEDYEGEWQAGGSANSLEDAQRDGMRYLQIYTQDGFHRLIIRRHCTKIIQEINNA